MISIDIVLFLVEELSGGWRSARFLRPAGTWYGFELDAENSDIYIWEAATKLTCCHGICPFFLGKYHPSGGFSNCQFSLPECFFTHRFSVNRGFLHMTLEILVEPLDEGKFLAIAMVKMSGQFITTSAEVTPNGGLVRESPPKLP